MAHSVSEVQAPDAISTLPAGPTRVPAARYTPSDIRLTAAEAEPGLVLTQGLSVLAGLQRGLHQPGLTQLTLSTEERRVINLHRNLERYMDLPMSERMTDDSDA